MTVLRTNWVKAIVLLLALWLPVQAAAAQSAASFTLAIGSGFARSGPSLSSSRAASLFQGLTYTVNGRTPDGQWVRLSLGGLTTEAWAPVGWGTVNGSLESVPVAQPGAAAPVVTPAVTPTVAAPTAGGALAPAPTDSAPAPSGAVYQPHLPVIPAVSQTAIDIYQRGLARGNNPNAFSKIGDCQAVTPYFLAAFDYGPSLYSLGEHGHLQATIDHFAGSFARNSVAANSGFNVTSLFVPLWSDPVRCLRGESPLACELRLNRPSFAIISMETWWGGSPAGYESYMRRIIETLIARGTVPILGTKADNIEGDGSINAVIVKVAQEYDIPLWNFWAAVQPLPNQGLHPDGFHLTWERNFFDSPSHMQNAWPVRNLTALQALDAVRRGVSGN